MTYNKKEHLKQSIHALKTVFVLEKENRKATAQEMDTMRQYKGFGAIKTVLRPLTGKDTWPKSEQSLYPLIEELDQLLRDNTNGEEAYKDCLNSIRSSVLTAFYTPEAIIRAIADSLHTQGIKAEKILEPSAGIGVFFNAFRSNEPIVAYEKDIMTARILSKLFPNDTIRPFGYETIDSTYAGYFDMIVSNIPFGDVSVFDPDFVRSDDKVKRFASQSLHNYFFVKSVGNLREGGILAFITTQAVMNTPSNEPVRQYLMDNTNLVTAIRLPNNLFASHAGTEVGTDLILLQKNSNKVGLSPNELSFIKTETSQNRITTNLYFETTENIIHTSQEVGTNLYGNPAMVYSFDGDTNDIAHELSHKLTDELDKNLNRDLFHKYEVSSGKQIKIESMGKVTPQLSLYDLFGLSNEERTQIKPVKRGKKSISTQSQKISVIPFDNSPRPFKNPIPAYYKEGMLATLDTYVGYTRLENDHLVLCPMEIAKEQEQKILTYINIRDTYLSLYIYELDNQKADTEGRERLNQAYDRFVELYGYFAEPSNLEFIGMDKLSAEIFSLEQWQGQEVSKADIFFHPVGFSIQEETHTDDIFEALSFSLNRYMKVDMDYICRLTGIEVESIKESLFDKICWNPFDKEYQMREVYIAGNVVEKANSLEIYLRDNPDDTESGHTYDAMKAAIPERIPFEELDFNLGERWINDSVYSNFASQLFDTNVTVVYDSSGDDYVVSYSGYSSAIFHQYNVQGQNRNYNGIKLLEHALLNTSPNITKTITKDGQEIRVRDANAIQLANTKIEEIRNLFNEWLKNKDGAFKDALAKNYNDRYNCFVRPQYDGAHQKFPELNLKALNIPDLYKSQKDAIYMLKCNQGGIIDHEVGGGKTLVICVAAYEMKRLGIVNRPLIIGLKANIDAIATTYVTAYPDARILYSGNEDFSPSSREQFFYKLKNNSWDAIILTHEQFGMIPQSEDIQTKILKQELDSTEENLQILHKEKSISTQLLKGLIKRKENLSAKLKVLQLKMDLQKEDVTDFKSLGIDHIFVDESHIFKNLMFTTRHDRVAGIGNNTGSQRALNMLYAIRTIQERTGRDLGATFLSGTVISNSLTELYSVFKYMRPKALESQNIRSFDAWAAVFAKKTIDYEFSVTNEIIQKERFRYFIKVPELAQFYNEITDYRTAEEIGIDRPEKNTILRNIPQTAEQEVFAKQLIAFAKTGDGTLIGRSSLSDAEMTAKMLIATNTSKKMSLDMRLVDPALYSDDPHNKVSIAAQELADRYYRFNNCKGTQFVFCDLGTYKKERWNVYSELKRKLVEEYNIPSAEIRFIQEATSDKVRNNIINLMNKGVIRILVGSTQKLGTGVNAQQRAVAVHHLDVTWRPSDLTQRDGRAVRKGNEVAKLYANNKVDILFYAVQKTLDSYMFNLLHNKQLFITQMKRGTAGVRTLDEGSLDESNGMNFSEYVAILSGNPELLEKARLEKKIATMESERISFLRNKRRYNDKISSYVEALNNKNRIIAQLEKDSQQLSSQMKYDEKSTPIFPILLNGTHSSLTTSKEIGAYLCKLADNMDTNGKEIQIGSLYGFRLYVQTKTVQAENELFKTNKFFVQGNGGINYTHLNGVLPHTPELAAASFSKALQLIPKLSESAIVERNKIEKDIQAFNEIAYSSFAKEQELTELKERLNTVERNLQLSLSNDVTEGQSDEEVSEPESVYYKHTEKSEKVNTLQRQIEHKPKLYNQRDHFILRDNETKKTYSFSRSNIEVDHAQDEVRIAVPKKYVDLLLEVAHLTHDASVRISSKQSSLCPDIKLTEMLVSPISGFPFLVHKTNEEINLPAENIAYAYIKNDGLCLVAGVGNPNIESKVVLNPDEYSLYKEGMITPLELAGKYQEELLHYSVPNLKGTTDQNISQATFNVNDVLLAPSNRIMKEGEFCSIERTFTKTGSISFCGSDKIETPEDVAWIFRSLENSAVENGYMAYIANEKTIVQHLSIGSFSNTEFPMLPIIAAVNKLKPTKIYMVHNHPSGVLRASRQDMNIHEKLRLLFGDIVSEGIIINLTSGKYGTFQSYNDQGATDFKEHQGATSFKIPIYSFNRLVFEQDFTPEKMTYIRCAQDIAAFISSHRLGERNKLSILVIDRGNRITANIFTSHIKVSTDNVTEIAQEAVNATILYGGSNFILNSNFNVNEKICREMEYEVKRLSGGAINPFDVLSVNDMGYVSASEEGYLSEAGNESEERKKYISKSKFVDYTEMNSTSVQYLSETPKQIILFDNIYAAMQEALKLGIPVMSVPFTDNDPASFNEFASEYGFHVTDVMTVYEQRKNSLGDFFNSLLDDLLHKNGNSAKLINFNDMEQNVNKVDEARINWDDLKSKFGITKEMLEEKGVLNEMLYFKKSDELFKVSYQGHNELKDFDARLAFREKDGSYTLQFYPVKNKPELEKPYCGYIFTEEDKNNLLQTRHLGKVVEIQPYNREKKQVYISIDPLTNDITHVECSRINLKEEIKGVLISNEQKELLQNGKPVFLSGMIAKSGKPFDAFVQIDADKKGLSFSFPKVNKSEQVNINELKEIKGVKLTQQQHDALRNGDKIELDGLIRNTGGTFSALVHYDSESKKIKFDFPEHAGKPQEAFISNKIKGVQLSPEQKQQIQAKEKVLIQGMTSKAGKPFDAFVFLDKKTNRLEMEFPVKDHLMGVTFTTEQKNKLQAGQTVWIDGLTKKDGGHFKAPILWNGKEGKFSFEERKQVQATSTTNGIAPLKEKETPSAVNDEIKENKKKGKHL